ncbi:MAG TPA: sulfotransferase [Woeseiaceae bacterium]|nr:sulfotransferase [Woeseiaceae bacterium]
MNPNSSNRPAGTLETRLSEIERLLGTDPRRAEALAAAVLAEAPGHSMALLFQGMARRLAGDPAAAIVILRPLCEQFPEAPLPHLQLGLALRETGDDKKALDAMRRAVHAKPDFADAWLALVHLLTTLGAAETADAYASYIRHAMQSPVLQSAEAALRENREREAETLLRKRLEGHPRDVVALRLLAQVAARVRRLADAEVLLLECLRLAPAYREAREDYASVLVRQARPGEALREIEALIQEAPGDAALETRRAAILLQLLDYEGAAAAYTDLARKRPGDAGLQASLGHCLRILGRSDESVEAYRRAISLAPASGEAWWNLANLKTYRISDDDLAAILEQLENPGLGDADRLRFHFAAGKALEDRQQYEEAFRHYSEGNRLRRRGTPYTPTPLHEHVERSCTLFTREFFAGRQGWGVESDAPIFIVGLPRSGSTLVEQILASHSAVEGTTELPHVPVLVNELAARLGADAIWPDCLVTMEAREFRELGEAYLERTRPWRKLGRPRFIDKLPNNFENVALIHLMLPNARIVDVRRHPMACGLSLFRHLFAHGQHFSYSLEDIGSYYGAYLRLMMHFETVLPGRIHLVSYENLVRDTETEIRCLLEHCRLPFEEACLHFHENARPVSTPSSEQVRSPIFSEGLEQWRHFEPWLGPLRNALAASSRDSIAPGG